MRHYISQFIGREGQVQATPNITPQLNQLMGYGESGWNPVNPPTVPIIGDSNVGLVDTYAELRTLLALPVFVYVRGGVEVDDGAQGWFINLGETGSENGALAIAHTNGDVYHRLWDNVNFLVDWFPIGGVDRNGASYNEAENTGIVDGATQLTNAILLSPQFATICGIPNKIYTWRRGVSISDRNIRIRNMRIKRAASEVTTTSAQINNGATSIPVVDASIFRVGDRIALADVTLPNGGQAHEEGSNDAQALIIQTIVGNTITTGQGAQRVSGSSAWPSGTKVFRINNLIVLTGTGTKIIEQCEFDGNEEENDNSYSWVMNTALRIDGPATISRCIFRNSPGESIYTGPGTTIRDCEGYDLFGSFVHMSQGAADVHAIRVINNYVDGVCLAGTLATHNQATVTWSAAVDAVEISGNTFKNGSRGCFGDLGGDSVEAWVRDNYFENFDYICRITNGPNISAGAPIKIEKNTFKNCGDLRITGTAVRKGHSVQKASVEDCEFYGNTRIWCWEVSDLNLRNLLFRYSDGATFKSTIYDEVSSNQPEKAAINLKRGTRVLLENIVIELSKAYNAELAYGIFAPARNSIRIKNSGGTDLAYWYGQDNTFRKIRILFGRYGLMCDDNLGGTNNFSSVGWRFEDITVVGYPDTTHTPDGTQSCGILIPPGAYARNLRVFSLAGATNIEWWPLLAQGIHSTGPVSTNRGCLVDGYTLIGPANRGLCLGARNANRSNKNVVCINGKVTVTTVHNTTSDSYVEQIDIGVANLPLLTAEDALPYQTLFENAGVY